MRFLRAWSTALLFAVLGRQTLASKQPFAAPVGVWNPAGNGVDLTHAATVDLQQLMNATRVHGVLWIQDRYLTTGNAAVRYPDFFGGGSSDSRPSAAYLAGKDLFPSPASLPPRILVTSLSSLEGVPAGQVAFYDVASGQGFQPPQELIANATLRGAAVVVLSGPVTLVDADEIAAAQRRRLQDLTEAATETPEPADPAADDLLNLKAQDLPAIFYLAFFLGTILVGLSMLHAIDSPVAFEDKLLPINREY